MRSPPFLPSTLPPSLIGIVIGIMIVIVLVNVIVIVIAMVQSRKRISPFDDELGIFPDAVILAEDEERSVVACDTCVTEEIGNINYYIQEKR